MNIPSSRIILKLTVDVNSFPAMPLFYPCNESFSCGVIMILSIIYDYFNKLITFIINIGAGWSRFDFKDGFQGREWFSRAEMGFFPRKYL